MYQQLKLLTQAWSACGPWGDVRVSFCTDTHILTQIFIPQIQRISAGSAGFK